MNDESRACLMMSLCQRIERLRQGVADVATAGGAQAGLDMLGTGLEELRNWAEILERDHASVSASRQPSAAGQAQDWLQTVFQCAPLPILVLDPQGRVQLWTGAAETIFGWSAAEAEGQLPPFVPPEGHEDHRRWCEHEIRREALPRWDLKRCQDKRGESLDFLRSSAPLKGPDGEVTGLVALYLDLTEKASLEALLLCSQRLESIAHQAGGIAHDLNNVLSPVVMAAPILRDEIATPAVSALLNALEASARRGADIVKQILGFSGGFRTDKVPLQTRYLLRETAEIMSQTLPGSVGVKINLPRGLWLVEGNRTHLRQALMNLCLNARDAMPDGGTLTIEAANLQVDEALANQTPELQRGPYVVWTLSNTGAGNAPNGEDRSFDPSGVSKTLGHGSDLRLNAAVSILRIHGGIIQVQSQDGQGTTCKVLLPAIQADQEEQMPGIPALPARHGQCLLIVDDEENIRILLRAVLERQGYRVLVASGGPEALALWRQHQEIHLVITDLRMPGMSGVELIRALREIAPQVKVVVNTGVADESLLAQLVPLRVNAVLAKPAETSRLLATLERILATRPGSG